MQASEPLLIPFVLVVLALLALLLALIAVTMHSRRSRQRLQIAIHDRAMELDQRCDILGTQIAHLDELARLSHLSELIDSAVAEHRISSAAAGHLRRQVRAWRSESLAAEENSPV